MMFGFDDGEELIPKWKAEVMVDERLSQERDLIIRKIKALPTYGRMYKDKYNHLVKVGDVVEAIERSSQ